MNADAAGVDVVREQLRLRRLRAKLPTSRRDLDLFEFIPKVTPRFHPPRHLTPLVEALERTEREQVHLLVSVPPRHGKTECLLHALAWKIARHPEQTCGYVSYAADIARSKSRQARDYALEAGVTLRMDSAALNEWRTQQGGGMLATGIGGPLTGFGVDGVLICDDTLKNRADAESSRIRDNIFQWWTSTALTRVEPKGSVIVCGTRWHDDDLLGRLSRESGWEVVNLPALDDEGQALWPAVWPVDVLIDRRRRVGEYDWSSLFMGQPRPRGAGVFESATVCEAVPIGPVRYAIGLDFAYTEKAKSDYSVAAILAEIAGVSYVVDVVRRQCAAPAFAMELAKLGARYPSATMFAFVGGTEKGVVDLLNSTGLRIRSAPAVSDKFVRAQACAAAWNNGTIVVPRTAHWASDFISEVVTFPSGVHDDQVDALVGAYHVLHQPSRAPNRYLPENIYG